MNDEAMVVWQLYSCVEGDFYDRSALYDDYSEMLAQMRQELDEGRIVMVKRELMLKAEFDALPEIEGMWTSGV